MEPSRCLSATLLLSLCALFGSETLKASVRPSDSMLDVAEELENRGVDLCVVRLPVRYELYESEETPWDQPLEEKHENTLAADREALRLMLAGIRVVDLYPKVRQDISERDIYSEDRFHFTGEYDEELSGALMRDLYGEGLMLREPNPRNIIFFGDCFAGSLGEGIAERNSFDEVNSLVKLGGGGIAHNHLFAFGDKSLREADLAVWVLTDRMFTDPAFAALELDALNSDLKPEVLEAQVVEITPVDQQTADVLPYPNAIRATMFQRLDTGERFIGVNFVARNRRLQRSASYEPGKTLRLSLVPLQEFQQSNPEVASEFMMDSINAFELPQYWIAGWMDNDSDQIIEIHMQET